MYEHLGSFGHWISGFTDGEGSFTIHHRKIDNRCYCCFTLSIRDDDAKILYDVHDAWGGIGVLKTMPAREPSKPQICLRISRQHECLNLCQFFHEYPLRAKKATDFLIWERSVKAMTQMRFTGKYDWQLINRIRRDLANGRAYPE